MRRLLIITATVVILALCVGCVTVQERDDFTIEQISGLRQATFETLTEAAEAVTDLDAKAEVIVDRDIIDTEFDALLTYEMAKEHENAPEDHEDADSPDEPESE